jgi:hypothetical protein
MCRAEYPNRQIILSRTIPKRISYTLNRDNTSSLSVILYCFQTRSSKLPPTMVSVLTSCINIYMLCHSLWVSSYIFRLILRIKEIWCLKRANGVI